MGELRSQTENGKGGQSGAVAGSWYHAEGGVGRSDAARSQELEAL